MAYETKTLYLNFKGLMSKHLHIADESKNLLYDVEMHTSSPNFRIKKVTSENPDIGTVNVTKLAKTFNLNLNNRNTVMEAKNWAQKTYSFQSGTAPGKTFTWSGGLGQTCTDEKGIALAKSQFAKMSLHKLGTLELTGEALALSDEFVDELVLGCAAIMVQRWMTMASPAVAAASSS